MIDLDCLYGRPAPVPLRGHSQSEVLPSRLCGNATLLGDLGPYGDTADRFQRRNLALSPVLTVPSFAPALSPILNTKFDQPPTSRGMACVPAPCCVPELR
jgi:hypothetical protein